VRDPHKPAAPARKSAQPARGRRAVRLRDADATRARILAAATEEFMRHGYAGARGDRIVQRAGASERMLYYYFGSKEGVFRAVLEEVYIALRVAESSLHLDDLPPREALARFCNFVWRYYVDHPEFVGIVNAENLCEAKHLRKSTRLRELVSPVVGQLERLLARGVQSGDFRADVDPAQLYVTIASLGYFPLSNRYTLSAVLGRDLADPQNLAGHWRASEECVLRYVGVV
jgi:AcrR family transcriptional regulator